MLADAKYECSAVGKGIKIKMTDRGPKGLMEVSVDQETVEIWLVLDPDDRTTAGTPRTNYTESQLKALGAVDPLDEIGAAIEADENVQYVELTGYGSTTAVLEVKRTPGYKNPNYNIWPTRPPLSKSLGSKLRSASGGKGKAKMTDENPFASKPLDPDSFDPAELERPAR